MKTLKDFLGEYNSINYEEIEDIYENMLDELYEPVNLAGMTIYASDMKSIDPVMFRCSVADYSSEEYEEYENDYYLKSDYENAENDFSEYEEEQEENGEA